MNLSIRIADIALTLVLDDCSPEASAHTLEHYQAFTAPPQPYEHTIHVRSEPGDQFIPPHPSHILQIHTDQHNNRITFESHTESGWLDRTTGQGVLILRPKARPENFLRVVCAWICVEQSALLLHAAGIIRKGRGYVFFGPSGSGKSTTSRLSLDHTILSDDLVIIKKHYDGYRVHGVPFRGDFPEAPRTNASVELDRVFALAKADRHHTTPLSTTEAVARLTACVPFVMRQPATARRVVEICEDLARHVQVNQLHFAPNNEFWKVIDELAPISRAA